jgi:ferrochelatase
LKPRGGIGVLLLNLGGPDSPQAVRPFLLNLFSDRMIIPLGPPFLQRPLAWLIATLRAPKARRAYALIGGASPLKEITLGQARALQEVLPEGFSSVKVGMRYWRPFIQEALEELKVEGVRRLLALSLYPHYSVATTGSALAELKRLLEERFKGTFELRAITQWPTEPHYVQALKEAIGEGLRASSQGAVVLFSAHALPESFIRRGDPYVEHLEATIGALTEGEPYRWMLCYQSRTGPMRWLSPSTEEALRELAAEGVKEVLVVPLSFVSDHIETLYEIDILYKSLAEGLGLRLRRTPGLNTHPGLIQALRALAVRGAREAGWLG